MIKYFWILIVAFTILLVLGFWVTKPRVENYKNKDDYQIFVLELKDEDYEFDFNKEKVMIFPFTDSLNLGYKSKLLKDYRFRKINNNYELTDGKKLFTIKTNKDEEYPVRILVDNYDYYINIKKSDKKHKQNNINVFEVKFNNVDIGEIEETIENGKTSKIRLRTKDDKLKKDLPLLTSIFSGFLIEEMKENLKQKDLDEEPDEEKKFDKI